MTWNEVAHGECCTCMLNVSYGNVSSPSDSSFRFVNTERERESSPDTEKAELSKKKMMALIIIIY